MARRSHGEARRLVCIGSTTMNMGDATRADFPILTRIVNGYPLVYLDSAASSQKPASVIEAISGFYEQQNANVHRSIHTLGEEATERYEAARDSVRAFIGARARQEVIFTRGTTEGVNVVARAMAPTLRPGDEVLVTEMEHNSNVLGTINPVARMTELAHDAGALVLVDGAQAVPHLALDVAALGADFYVFSGHKMLGPTGIGVLYGRRDVMERLEPAWGGSEMIKEVWIDHAQWNDLPWRFEPGTPPIAEAVGLHAAIEYLDKLGMTRVTAHEQELTALCLDALAAIPGVTVYGPRNPEMKGAVVAFNVAGLHPHDGAALLDQRGIAIRAGHHCAQPLMKRLGISGTLRASFSVYTTAADVERLASAVGALANEL